MNSYFEDVENNLRRLKLATHLLAEVHAQLLDPLYPDSKADLLIASEDLAETALDILTTAREMAWNHNLTPPSDFS